MLLCGWIVFASATLAQAPHLRFDHLSTDQGLSQASVHAIYQDSVGFMWFGTQDGLNRWDGARFLQFRHRSKADSGLSENRILSITEDPDGRILVGTKQGAIDAYDPATGEFQSVLSPGSEDADFELGGVRRFAWESERFLWVGAENGLALLDVQSGNARLIPLVGSSTPTVQEIRCLVRGPREDLWLCHSGGLGVVRGGVESPGIEPQADVTEPASIRSIAFDRDGRLWAASDGHLILMEGDRQTEVVDLRKQTSPRLRIEKILFDRQQRLWVGSTDGLFLLRPDGRDFYLYQHARADPNSLSNNEIRSIYEDRSGTLWFGTLGGGVDRWHPSSLAFGRYPAAQEFEDNSTYSFAKTGHGEYWVGTRGGLVFWDETRPAFRPFEPAPDSPPFPSSARAMSLLGDRQGRLWIGTRRYGLYRYDPKTDRLKAFRSSDDPERPPRSGIMSLFESSDGTLFVGTSDAGLSRFEPSTETFSTYPAGPPDGSHTAQRVARIAETEAGGLWLAAYDQGLDYLDLETGRVSHFRHQEDVAGSLPADSVAALHVDDAGRLWIGTLSAGFAVLDSVRISAGKAEFRSWDESHGLPNNTVYGILSDSDGIIWLSTNRGLARFDPKSESFLQYKPRHGLQDWEFNFGAYFQDDDGHLFFGGVGGFNRLQPEAIDVQTTPPPVAISGLQINNREVPVPRSPSDGAPLELDYRDTSLSFRLAALDFSHSDSHRFAYRLEGFDQQWIEPEEVHSVVYTNLDPGAYTFRARAAHPDGGDWSPEIHVPIRVAYAPWESWWARLLYSILAGGFVYAVVRWRLSALQRRSEELKELVDRRTHELKHTVDRLRESEGSALDAKRRALKSLEEALEERRKAQEADQAKSVFLSNMSHELRTPLNAVLGFAQLMERDPQITAEHEESLKIILRSGEHLLSLINDVLSLAKIEAGRLTLVKTPFRPRHLCRDVEEMVRPKASEKSLRLTLDIAEDVPEAVEGDSSRLIQILLNLLGNAVKFTTEGEVSLKLEMKSHLIDFTVSDTGVGIPEEDLAHLFEPFQQTEAGRAEKEGTGLGLTISERLVELMGGTLRVDSREGIGSQFAFALPLPKVDPDLVMEKKHRVVGIRLDQKPPKILVVDDTRENRELLKKLFEDIGMPVRTAANGKQAVETWRQWRPSLIWMDMRMPEMDGYEATRRIRHEEAELVAGRTTILALTAAAFEDDRREILKAGCDDVLTKPYQEHLLFKKMTEHLDLIFVYGEPDEPKAEPVVQAAGVMLPKAPIRLLIAEDNLANQMVAKRMIERLGYEADVVSNGSLVLSAFDEFSYPLVLMDIRMPKLDGVGATRELRSTLPAARQPAIIALTGLASEDERRVCLRAGMDDLLAKPFRIEDLQAKIERWLPRDGKPVRRHEQPAPDTQAVDPQELKPMLPDPTSDPSVLDRGKLALLHQLDDGTGSQSLAIQVISLFLDTVPGQLRELQRAVMDGDIYRWRRVAHSLKNSSSTLGAEKVSSSCLALEQLARQSQSEKSRGDALVILDQLSKEADTALQALALERKSARYERRPTS